jgi:hypothetical protein
MRTEVQVRPVRYYGPFVAFDVVIPPPETLRPLIKSPGAAFSAGN